ncbi:MAG: DUF1624 domain-containing protein [Asgard group archaeon]|nr:DUF1624 domain-containing protein [Asgard group archaeon]
MNLIGKNTDLSYIESSKLPRRIITFDFLRGLAIFAMTFMHTFEHLYDYTWVKEDSSKILSLPLPVLLIGLITFFFMSWNDFFLLISSTVNSYSISNKIKNNPARQILIKQVITGFGILLAGVFADNLGYWGYFGQSLLTGDWRNLRPLWERFFTMNTLQIIGWSMIINGIIQVLLLRKNGYKKFLRNMLVYAILIISVLVSTTFIHNWVDNMPWIVPENPPPSIYDNTKWPSQFFQAENASFKAWIMALLAGDLEPLFPYLATSFSGTMIGMTLAQEKPVRRLPLWGALGGLGMMGTGGILLWRGFFTLSNGRPAIGNYMLKAGGQICAIMLIFHLVEYKGKAAKFAKNPIVKYMRLWSMASLTIYCLQIFEILPRWVLSNMLRMFSHPINLLKSSIFGFGKEYLAILVALFCLVYFNAVVSIWAKFNFKFSFEWVIAKLASFGSKQSSHRLNIAYLMNNIEWLNYNNIKK